MRATYGNTMSHVLICQSGRRTMSSLLPLAAAGLQASLPHLHRTLEALSDHNAFATQRQDELQLIVPSIIQFLSRGVTRIRGLIILKSLLESKAVPEDVISVQGPLWLPLCINTLRPNVVPTQEKALAYTVISDLLTYISKIHELDRSTVITHFTDLIDYIVKSKPELHVPALLCLQTLLLRYSKNMGTFKVAIEKFLIQFLDNEDKKTVTYAAKCAHLLQQIRGGGEQGVNHKEAWKSQFHLYIIFANDIVKELTSISNIRVNYGNVTYLNDENNCEDVDTFLSIYKNIQNRPFYNALKNVCSDSPLSDFIDKDVQQEKGTLITLKVEKLFLRLENLLIFIQSMLIDPYPVAKSIECNAVFNLLLHCLSLKCKISNQQLTLDTMAIMSFVPGLYSVVMRTLEALIICIHSNILPYTLLVLKIVLELLESTKAENYSCGIKPYKNVRKAAYRTLSCLFSVVCTLKPPLQGQNQGFEDRLLDNLLDDIAYFKPSMQLTVKNVGSLKYMSKKARRKLTMSQLEASNLPQNVGQQNAMNTNRDDFASINADLTQAALSCLESFFKASGVFLKQSSHKLVQETIVKEIYSRPSNKIINESLCKFLLVIQIYQSRQQPSIMSYCVDTFSRNQHSENYNLGVFCNSSLNNTMGLIRGNAPSLEFPIIQSSESNNVRHVPEINNSEDITRNEGSEIIDLDAYSTKKHPTNKATDSPVIDLSDNQSDELNSSGKRKKLSGKYQPSKVSKISSNITNKVTHLEIFDSSEDDCMIENNSVDQNNLSSAENENNGGICMDDIVSSSIDIDNNVENINNGSEISNDYNSLCEKNYSINLESLDKSDENIILQTECIEAAATDNSNTLTVLDAVSKTTATNTLNGFEDTKVDIVPKNTENEAGMSVEDMIDSFVDGVLDEFK